MQTSSPFLIRLFSLKLPMQNIHHSFCLSHLFTLKLCVNTRNPAVIYSGCYCGWKLLVCATVSKALNTPVCRRSLKLSMFQKLVSSDHHSVGMFKTYKIMNLSEGSKHRRLCCFILGGFSRGFSLFSIRLAVCLILLIPTYGFSTDMQQNRLGINSQSCFFRDASEM